MPKMIRLQIHVPGLPADYDPGPIDIPDGIEVHGPTVLHPLSAGTDVVVVFVIDVARKVLVNVLAEFVIKLFAKAKAKYDVRQGSINDRRVVLEVGDVARVLLEDLPKDHMKKEGEHPQEPGQSFPRELPPGGG